VDDSASNTFPYSELLENKVEGSAATISGEYIEGGFSGMLKRPCKNLYILETQNLNRYYEIKGRSTGRNS
jgi:hypothetical protein